MDNKFTRRIPIAYRPWLEDQLKKLGQHRIIEPVQAKHGPAWLSNLLIVPKQGKDKLRLCFDLREVNKNIISEQWPLPNIKDCVESMAGARLFTCLDLRAAYHAIEIEEVIRRYLGFGYQGKQYVYRKMPFGLSAAPSIFCRYMSKILGRISNDFYNLYMDDCVIYSKTIEEHVEHVDAILTALEEGGMKVNLQKSKFFTNKIVYLGFKLGLYDGKYGMRPRANKIAALVDAPEPRTAKAVKGYCSGISFYGGFYPNMQVVLSPLYQGAASDKFEFTDEMSEAFKKSKELLKQITLLHFPDKNKVKILRTDASGVGVGAVLSQKINYDDKIEREEVLMYFSRTFNKTEQRWSAIEKETAALLWAMTKFRIYLVGNKFVLESDNKSLCHMIKNPPKSETRTSMKLNRYMNFINSMDFEIHHKPGASSNMSLADFLSRYPTVENNKDVDIMNIESFLGGTTTRQQWELSTKRDQQLSNSNGNWTKYKNRLIKIDGLIYLRGSRDYKLAVPDCYRDPLLWYYHTKYSCHGGYNYLVRVICSLYFFPNIHRKILRYVKKCQTCTQHKNIPFLKNKRQATSQPTKPGEYIQIDLVGPISKLPSEKGNRYILTYIDTFTGYLAMRPIPSKHSAVVIEAL